MERVTFLLHRYTATYILLLYSYIIFEVLRAVYDTKAFRTLKACWLRRQQQQQQQERAGDSRRQKNPFFVTASCHQCCTLYTAVVNEMYCESLALLPFALLPLALRNMPVQEISYDGKSRNRRVYCWSYNIVYNGVLRSI